jgi:hypothetical protein
MGCSAFSRQAFAGDGMDRSELVSRTAAQPHSKVKTNAAAEGVQFAANFTPSLRINRPVRAAASSKVNISGLDAPEGFAQVAISGA